MTANKRLSYIDYTKGFAIILVVLSHTIGGLTAGGIIGAGFYSVINEVIYTFHMPLFFFVSGFLSTRILEQTPRSFFSTNFLTIIAPYVLWSWIFLVFSFASPNNINHHYTASNFLEIFVPGKSVGVYWFLYALLIARVLYFFARRSTNRVVAVFVAFSLIYLLCEAFLVGSEKMPNLADTLLKFSRAGTFVGFGLIAATNQTVKQTILSPRLLPFWAIGWIGATALIVYSLSFEVLRFATGFLGTALTLSLARQIELKSKYRPQFLSDIGKATIAIFVAHVIFAAATRTALLKFGVHGAFIQVFLGTAAGVIFPLILFYAANYLRIAPLAGFGKNVPVVLGGLDQLPRG